MTDIEIAQKANLKRIDKIAKKLKIKNNELEYYGEYKAKIKADRLYKKTGKRGKLVLVTATNPTPFGEGKTTTTISLVDALNRLGKKSVATLREPSMGPVFGTKGGATGGGYSQVVPMEDINLHFTGDLHAITAANNLMCAALDNHIFQGNKLNINENEIRIKRCLDVNDRALRSCTVNGRETGFQITVASEVMACFCLSYDIYELKEKLGKIIVAYDNDGKEVYCRDLKVDGAMAALLIDAMKPNLVQTLEGNPAIIHGGPFANIAHGTCSILATEFALSNSDFVVTEAGFGSDLGAEKFFDIVSRKANLKPDCTVLVTTVRSVKYNADIPTDNLVEENLDAIQKGICNLEAHIENLKKFGTPVIVVLNKFSTDRPSEIEIIKETCKRHNAQFSICEGFAKGGLGALDAAKKILNLTSKAPDTKYIYNLEDDLKTKIEKLAKNIYGAGIVSYTDLAEEKIKQIEKLATNLPICVAKTQFSLSDDKTKLGRPDSFEFHVSDISLSNGAGFVVVYAGGVMTMPGLSKKPALEMINVTGDKITGLF
ncbi:MAG: formate--tetrahydrofolate ligase [Clostridia bacterium]|nr:formate--tetrahydrofolate ligase [Clostridia bacterium]